MTIFSSPGLSATLSREGQNAFSSAGGGGFEEAGGGKIPEFYLQMIFMVNSSLA